MYPIKRDALLQEFNGKFSACGYNVDHIEFNSNDDAALFLLNMRIIMDHLTTIFVNNGDGTSATWIRNITKYLVRELHSQRPHIMHTLIAQHNGKFLMHDGYIVGVEFKSESDVAQFLLMWG